MRLTFEQPEDNMRVIVSWIYGVPVLEHLYVPISLSYLKEPVIDAIDTLLETVYGHPVPAHGGWRWREADACHVMRTLQALDYRLDAWN
jgi:hypothetical protein